MVVHHQAIFGEPSGDATRGEAGLTVIAPS